ncbi:FAD-dependent monooxygenase [Streptomyces beihaiensis]|uniref:FAD-dependent monooxygenase n=1 Tax=Streptomyces beihaiensis TaxID=2984495 RepID=A0ABT3TSP9_9ACTN|nr:FAD-dependent monooxygenase [Streptomyces beihaiensis]MCX3059442.1 FAD-dependent monooxygenase [Streptomyces beihaiensis]
MKVTCAGGGPAGLYLAILLKLRQPDPDAIDVTVHEKHPAGSTYGWGVTYWPDMLDTLRAHDLPSARAIEARSVRWRDGVAHVGDRTTVHHGDEGFAIGRHSLLAVLGERATELGVRVTYASAYGPPHASTHDLAADADLVVAADGAHSTLRDRHADHFGTRVTEGRNRFVWLGTTKVFRSFTFAFVETGHGWVWCYAYGFDGEHSTFIVECAPATWRGLGLDTMPRTAALGLLTRLFAEPLDGHPLLGRTDLDGPAQWRTFPTVTNRVWSHGNLVLMGDAAHTTHYSTGAGTTAALRDAMALAEALTRTSPPGERSSSRPWDLKAALADYERTRKRELLPLQSAARHSAAWYENVTRYIGLEPERMFALLGQRHSPLLPYVPPQLYYRIDRAVDRSQSLRALKRRVGPRLARLLQRNIASG